MDQGGCPGSRSLDFSKDDNADNNAAPVEINSELRQWPIQMHLVSPQAPYFQGADVILVADCCAFAIGAFHQEFLKGKAIAIACPKLDDGQEVYVEKIKSWCEDANINTLSVMIMEVPCCMGLLSLAQQAVGQSSRKVPLESVVISLRGEIVQREWVN